MMSRLSSTLHHRTLSKSCIAVQNITACRALHLASPIRGTRLKGYKIHSFAEHRSILGAAFVRYASTDNATPAESFFESIPDAPVPPAPEVLDIVQAVGEPALKTLGLGGWTPVGMVQQCMEYLHIGCDIPWWGAIVIGTICVRTLLFPLVIAAQRNAAKMSNNLPQIQHLQLKMTEARMSGDQIEAARYGQEMMEFLREKDLNPLKTIAVPLAQAPLFMSFFLGLRGMANAPVESMREGGLWWFTDLTLPDEYFILPIVTSATMMLTIELGTDTAKLSAQNLGMMKYFLRALPVVILPFTINFPGAILCYWVSSNFISLLQVGFLKIPAIRTYFKIEALVEHKPSDLAPKKGFVKGFKESWSNMKITGEMEERSRLDELQFQRAGKGPVPKTYKYDPTRQAPDPTAILTKKR